MIILFPTIVILVVFYLLYSNGGNKSLPNAKILGTNSRANRSFHQFIVDPTTLRFKNDGMLLCFEKVERNRIIVVNKKKHYYSTNNQFELFDIDRDLNCMKTKDFSIRAIALIKDIFNDPKPFVLTHWVSTSRNSNKLEYNAYKTIGEQNYNLAKATINQFEEISEIVRVKFSEENFTHLVITCSGWNNYQVDSSQLYENWIKNTTEASKSGSTSTKFKPFVIGFTWSSRWIIPGVSIFNKANDADELGISHVNFFLWKCLLPSIHKQDIPILTIGHSFGARVLSRAIYSRFMLNSYDKNLFIDKSIDFQGAYPYSRYTKKANSNGKLYTIEMPVKKHYITYSKFDYALKFAFWSVGYIGNNNSISKILKSDAKSNFYFASLDSSGRIVNGCNGKNKILVDAKSIINKISSIASGAHNDVQDIEAGQFIWEVINR